MQRNRNLRRSVTERVADILSSGSYGLTAFNIYYESDLKSGATPTEPYIYLVESAIRPAQTELPMVVMEYSRVRAAPFELGNQSGRTITCFAHVFGKNRGQRDDVSSLIQDQIDASSVVVYDYTSGSGIADGTVIQVSPFVDVYEAPAGGKTREEATLLNLSVVSFVGITTE